MGSSGNTDHPVESRKQNNLIRDIKYTAAIGIIDEKAFLFIFCNDNNSKLAKCVIGNPSLRAAFAHNAGCVEARQY